MGESSIHIEAPAEKLYEMVSDVTRMGEWSPENLGGDWIDGATAAAVGVRFKGRNKRKQRWTTTCRITAADPGREFAFEVGGGDTVWRYRFEPDGSGTKVTESYEIVKPPGAFMRFLTKIGTGVSWADRPAQLQESMDQTLERLKAVAEAPAP
jgi:hypothetical protein